LGIAISSIGRLQRSRSMRRNYESQPIIDRE